jgi:hypothetical protein
VEVLADLKQTIYKSRGGTTEFARNFAIQYNISDRGLVSTAGKSAVYAESLLAQLARLLNVERDLPPVSEPKFDKVAMLERVREGLEKLRNGYVFFDESGNGTPRIIENPNNMTKIAKEYSGSEIVKGVNSAKDELESLLKKAGKGEYPAVREILDGLPEGLKTPVMYNIWKYCKINKGFKTSLKEFTESYNKGQI